MTKLEQIENLMLPNVQTLVVNQTTLKAWEKQMLEAMPSHNKHSAMEVLANVIEMFEREYDDDEIRRTTSIFVQRDEYREEQELTLMCTKFHNEGEEVEATSNGVSPTK